MDNTVVWIVAIICFGGYFFWWKPYLEYKTYIADRQTSLKLMELTYETAELALRSVKAFEYIIKCREEKNEL